jgi:exodeoxyribonuclease VII large subunit
VAHGRSRLRLLSPSALVERGFLRLDDLSNRLGASLRSVVQARRHGLASAAARLDRASPETRVQIESHRLLSLYKRLNGASPASVLNRGFAIVRDEKGKPVMRRAAVRSGERLEAEFADGRLPIRSE